MKKQLKDPFSGISLSDTEAKAEHRLSHHRVCVVRDLETHSDDRGWLREVVQADCGKLQVNISLTYPGVIKAFHRHANQADYFACVSGAVKYVVATETVDSMPGNNDYEFSVYILSEDHPRCIEVPSGVLHGYKVLGSKPAVVMYCATNWYDRDNPDEERVDPSIYSDWETENR